MKVKYLKLLVWFFIVSAIVIIVASFQLQGDAQIPYVVAACLCWVVSKGLNMYIIKKLRVVEESN